MRFSSKHQAPDFAPSFYEELLRKSQTLVDAYLHTRKTICLSSCYAPSKSCMFSSSEDYNRQVAVETCVNSNSGNLQQAPELQFSV